MQKIDRWWPGVFWIAIALFSNARVVWQSGWHILTRAPQHSLPAWFISYSFSGAIAQIVALTAIIFWKIWGWRLLLFVGLTNFFVIALLTPHPITSLSSLAGLIIGYGALKGGGDKAIWPRLA